MFFRGMYQPDSNIIYLNPLLYQQSCQSELIYILVHELEHKTYHEMQQCGLLTEKEQVVCDWFFDRDGDDETEWEWTPHSNIFDDDGH